MRFDILPASNGNGNRRNGKYKRNKGCKAKQQWRLAEITLLISGLLFTGRAARTQQSIYERDPFFGKNQYPQYRNISGLAGGGYGTDAGGYPSITGPTAFSTPTAYTLGHDHAYLGIGGINFRGVPSFDTNRSNSSGVVMYGHTFGQFNFAVTDFLKSASLDSAINLQASLIPLHKNRLGASLGVQDLLGLGGSSGTGTPTDRYSSQSVFFAFTYPISTGGDHPLYLSGGLGTHRFSKGFGSASYYVGGPLRAWLEYDGFGLNEGILLTHKIGRGHGSVNLNGNIGFVRGKYFLFSGGIGF